ncbi:hypothetical protein BDB01DRAFT_722473, partial [Pilobolus umbonatus]
YSIRDNIIFAININEFMFIKNEDDLVPITVCLQCVKQTMQFKAINNPLHKIGVILFGTDKKEEDTPYIHVLFDMEEPNPDVIKAIKVLIEDTTVIKDKYGIISTDYPYSDLFLACSEMFLNKSAKSSYKRLFILTNDDNPNKDNALFRSAAIHRATDLVNADTEIELFGINRSDHVFNPSLFYSSIVPSLAGEEKPSLYSLKGLQNKVSIVQTKKRREFNLPFHITEQSVVGVKGFSIAIKRKTLPSNFVATGLQQITEVESAVRYKCADTDHHLSVIDMKVAYDYGEEQIVFTPAEVQKILTFRDPGLVLIGFKDRKQLNDDQQISHPYFVTPDNSDSHMFIYSQNQYTCQISSFDTNSDIASIDTAKALVKRMTTNHNYDPKSVYNPCKKMQNMIEAIALDEKIKEPVDELQLEMYLTEKNTVEELKRFKEVLGLEDVDMEELAAQSKKRKVNDQPAKKASMNNTSVEEIWESGRLQNLTVARLTAYLVEKGITPKKKKADLINQVHELLLPSLTQ